MIRAATAADVPALTAMGRQFFEAAGLARVAAWDDASFATTATGLIRGEIDGDLVVIGDVPTGMLGVMLFPAYFNFAVKVAQEVFWWCDPAHRDGAGLAMLDTMEDRARARGASLFILGSIAGMRDATLERLYARRGYAPAENTFIKGL